MKKPQSISLLGNALFTGAQEASSKRRSDDKKDARKKKLLKYVFRGAESLGNKILNQKNEKFLQNENFYVRDALVSTNIEENKKRLDDWNNRLNYEGGEDNYFLDRATAKIQKMPMYANCRNNESKLKIKLRRSDFYSKQVERKPTRSF